MTVLKIRGLILLIFLFSSVMLFAQEQQAQTADTQTEQSASSEAPTDNAAAGTGDEGLKFLMGMQFGSIMVDGVNYTTVRLQPDFAFGKFGIGLDVNFEFDGNGNFRFSEWNSWQAVLSKILYVRYGQKKEPVYIKVGSISDFSLGNGFIMNRYSNMLNYPAIKKLGVAFDLDFNVFGFESMTENVFLFDILGLRAYYRPLWETDMPILKKLEIGATVAADLGPQNPVPSADKPYNFSYASSNQPAVVVGADIGLPIVELPVFTMRAYADYAMIVGKGSGEALGISGGIVSIVPYKLEMRLLQPKFVPYYFDNYYDSKRPYKYAEMDDQTNSSFGWLFASGVNLFNNMVLFGVQIEGTFETNSNPLLTASFALSKDLLKKVGLQFTYSRSNIKTFGDIFALQDTSAMFVANLDYFISDNLALTLSYRRTFAVASDGSVQPFSSTMISTRMAF